MRRQNRRNKTSPRNSNEAMPTIHDLPRSSDPPTSGPVSMPYSTITPLLSRRGYSNSGKALGNSGLQQIGNELSTDSYDSSNSSNMRTSQQQFQAGLRSSSTYNSTPTASPAAVPNYFSTIPASYSPEQPLNSHSALYTASKAIPSPRLQPNNTDYSTQAASLNGTYSARASYQRDAGYQSKPSNQRSDEETQYGSYDNHYPPTSSYNANATASSSNAYPTAYPSTSLDDDFNGAAYVRGTGTYNVSSNTVKNTAADSSTWYGKRYTDAYNTPTVNSSVTPMATYTSSYTTTNATSNYGSSPGYSSSSLPSKPSGGTFTDRQQGYKSASATVASSSNVGGGYSTGNYQSTEVSRYSRSRATDVPSVSAAASSTSTSRFGRLAQMGLGLIGGSSSSSTSAHAGQARPGGGGVGGYSTGYGSSSGYR